MLRCSWLSYPLKRHRGHPLPSRLRPQRQRHHRPKPKTAGQTSRRLKRQGLVLRRLRPLVRLVSLGMRLRCRTCSERQSRPACHRKAAQRMFDQTLWPHRRKKAASEPFARQQSMPEHTASLAGSCLAPLAGCRPSLLHSAASGSRQQLRAAKHTDRRCKPVAGRLPWKSLRRTTLAPIADLAAQRVRWSHRLILGWPSLPVTSGLLLPARHLCRRLAAHR